VSRHPKMWCCNVACLCSTR